MDQPAPIPFRRHHFLCALGFAGAGYSDDFVSNMAQLVGLLRAPGGDAQRLQVTVGADAICAPCPSRRGAGCAEGAKIAALDARHGAALGLAPGDVVSWGEAKRRIRERVPPGALDRLCAGCSWLDQGMCRDALARLHAAAEARVAGAAPQEIVSPPSATSV